MKQTHTRIREHGTHETAPKTGEQRIAAIREIVDRSQYAKVDGVMVDLFTAGMIMWVYNNINADNQAKFAAMPVQKMADIAYKLRKQQD